MAVGKERARAPRKWGYEIFKGLNQELVRDFFQFHDQNPDVLVLFRRFTKEMHNTGRSRYSSKAIMERIRWHYDIAVRGSDFKINNNYTAMYPRLLVMEDTNWMSFFSLRKFMPEDNEPYIGDLPTYYHRLAEPPKPEPKLPFDPFKKSNQSLF